MCFKEYTLCTYGFQLNASTHVELHSFAHDVHSLISTNNSFTISFDSEVRWCITGDLPMECSESLCKQTTFMWLIKLLIHRSLDFDWSIVTIF